MTIFDYGLDFKKTDFRKQPELYRVGISEQGVLLVEPYKSEILPHWRFRTPDIARLSAEKIYELYVQYKARRDFVGMDMARKFLQMGWTRSLRYFNHKSGQKYVGAVPTNRKGQSGAHGREVATFDRDYSKLESAKIFKAKLDTVKTDPVYIECMKQHQEIFESQDAGSLVASKISVSRKVENKNVKSTNRKRAGKSSLLPPTSNQKQLVSGYGIDAG